MLCFYGIIEKKIIYINNKSLKHYPYLFSVQLRFSSMQKCEKRKENIFLLLIMYLLVYDG